MIFTLTETRKLNGLNTEGYLRDIVARIVTTKHKDLESLLPFHWTPPDGSSPGDLTRTILHPKLAAP